MADTSSWPDAVVDAAVAAADAGRFAVTSDLRRAVRAVLNAPEVALRLHEEAALRRMAESERDSARRHVVRQRVTLRRLTGVKADAERCLAAILALCDTPGPLSADDVRAVILNRHWEADPDECDDQVDERACPRCFPSPGTGLVEAEGALSAHD